MTEPLRIHVVTANGELVAAFTDRVYALRVADELNQQDRAQYARLSSIHQPRARVFYGVQILSVDTFDLTKETN